MIRNILSIRKTVRLTIALVFVGLLFVSGCAEAADSFFYFTWQSNGSVPLGYPGKSLAVVGSMVKVSLQPLVYGLNNSYSDPSQWDCKWFMNDELQQEGKGLFNFRFIPTDYYAKQYTIKAEIKFPTGLTKSKEIIIPIAEPKVVLRLVGGKSEISGGVVDVQAEEVDLKSEAYFFSSSHLPLLTNWYLNGIYQFVKGEGANIFKVRRSDNSGNESKIKAIMESSIDSLVRGSGELNLNFY